MVCALLMCVILAALIEILSDQTIVPPAAFARSQDGRGMKMPFHCVDRHFFYINLFVVVDRPFVLGI